MRISASLSRQICRQCNETIIDVIFTARVRRCILTAAKAVVDERGSLQNLTATERNEGAV